MKQKRSGSWSSTGCAKRRLELWTLNFPEYSTTSNALMKRVRLIKSRLVMVQTSSSGSEATAEVEESSLPNPPVPRGTIETGGESPNITTSAVGSAGDPPREEPASQGEPEEESMDSDPDLMSW